MTVAVRLVYANRFGTSCVSACRVATRSRPSFVTSPSIPIRHEISSSLMSQPVRDLGYLTGESAQPHSGRSQELAFGEEPS